MTRILKSELPYKVSTDEVNEYQTPEGGSPLTADRITTLMTNLVLQTAYIDGLNKPMSLLLVSIAGSGKTRILQPLQSYKQVAYTNDITPKFLVEFLKQVDRGEKRFPHDPRLHKLSEPRESHSRHPEQHTEKHDGGGGNQPSGLRIRLHGTQRPSSRRSFNRYNDKQIRVLPRVVENDRDPEPIPALQFHAHRADSAGYTGSYS